MSGGGHRGHTAGPGSGGGGGASGCPAIQQNGARCGETKTLDIIREFRELYETKMKIIDSEAGGDCNVQAKLNLQTDWIHDLTEQNEMLVRAVEELEQEATQRVLALEDKLKETSKCCCEVMNGYNYFSVNLGASLQEIDNLRSDVRNLCERIRRIKKSDDWSLDGLEFKTINVVDDGIPIRGSADSLSNHSKDSSNNNSSTLSFICDENNEDKENKIRELEEKLRMTCEEVAMAKKVNENYAALKQSMLEMRDALTTEVADKHDTILALRRDVQMLEEQCRKADQQTHFKDDIIKELRKENKQLKETKSPDLRAASSSRKHTTDCGLLQDFLQFLSHQHQEAASSSVEPECSCSSFETDTYRNKKRFDFADFRNNPCSDCVSTMRKQRKEIIDLENTISMIRQRLRRCDASVSKRSKDHLNLVECNRRESSDCDCDRSNAMGKLYNHSTQIEMNHSRELPTIVRRICDDVGRRSYYSSEKLREGFIRRSPIRTTRSKNAFPNVCMIDQSTSVTSKVEKCPGKTHKRTFGDIIREKVTQTMSTLERAISGTRVVEAKSAKCGGSKQCMCMSKQIATCTSYDDMSFNNNEIFTDIKTLNSRKKIDAVDKSIGSGMIKKSTSIESKMSKEIIATTHSNISKLLHASKSVKEIECVDNASSIRRRHRGNAIDLDETDKHDNFRRFCNDTCDLVKTGMQDKRNRRSAGTANILYRSGREYSSDRSSNYCDYKACMNNEDRHGFYPDSDRYEKLDKYRSLRRTDLGSPRYFDTPEEYQRRYYQKPVKCDAYDPSLQNSRTFKDFYKHLKEDERSLRKNKDGKRVKRMRSSREDILESGSSGTFDNLFSNEYRKKSPRNDYHSSDRRRGRRDDFSPHLRESRDYFDERNFKEPKVIKKTHSTESHSSIHESSGYMASPRRDYYLSDESKGRRDGISSGLGGSRDNFFDDRYFKEPRVPKKTHSVESVISIHESRRRRDSPHRDHHLSDERRERRGIISPDLRGSRDTFDDDRNLEKSKVIKKTHSVESNISINESFVRKDSPRRDYRSSDERRERRGFTSPVLRGSKDAFVDHRNFEKPRVIKKTHSVESNISIHESSVRKDSPRRDYHSSDGRRERRGIISPVLRGSRDTFDNYGNFEKPRIVKKRHSIESNIGIHESVVRKDSPRRGDYHLSDERRERRGITSPILRGSRDAFVDDRNFEKPWVNKKIHSVESNISIHETPVRKDSSRRDYHSSDERRERRDIISPIVRGSRDTFVDDRKFEKPRVIKKTNSVESNISIHESPMRKDLVRRDLYAQGTDHRPREHSSERREIHESPVRKDLVHRDLYAQGTDHRPKEHSSERREIHESPVRKDLVHRELYAQGTDHRPREHSSEGREIKKKQSIEFPGTSKQGQFSGWSQRYDLDEPITSNEKRTHEEAVARTIKKTYSTDMNRHGNESPRYGDQKLYNVNHEFRQIEQQVSDQPIKGISPNQEYVDKSYRQEVADTIDFSKYQEKSNESINKLGNHRVEKVHSIESLVNPSKATGGFAYNDKKHAFPQHVDAKADSPLGSFKIYAKNVKVSQESILNNGNRNVKKTSSKESISNWQRRQHMDDYPKSAHTDYSPENAKNFFKKSQDIYLRKYPPISGNRIIKKISSKELVSNWQQKQDMDDYSKSEHMDHSPEIANKSQDIYLRTYPPLNYDSHQTHTNIYEDTKGVNGISSVLTEKPDHYENCDDIPKDLRNAEHPNDSNINFSYTRAHYTRPKREHARYNDYSRSSKNQQNCTESIVNVQFSKYEDTCGSNCDCGRYKKKSRKYDDDRKHSNKGDSESYYGGLVNHLTYNVQATHPEISHKDDVEKDSQSIESNRCSKCSDYRDNLRSRYKLRHRSKSNESILSIDVRKDSCTTKPSFSGTDSHTSSKSYTNQRNEIDSSHFVGNNIENDVNKTVQNNEKQRNNQSVSRNGSNQNEEVKGGLNKYSSGSESTSVMISSESTMSVRYSRSKCDTNFEKLCKSSIKIRIGSSGEMCKNVGLKKKRNNDRPVSGTSTITKRSRGAKRTNSPRQSAGSDRRSRSPNRLIQTSTSSIIISESEIHKPNDYADESVLSILNMGHLDSPRKLPKQKTCDNEMKSFRYFAENPEGNFQSSRKHESRRPRSLDTEAFGGRVRSNTSFHRQGRSLDRHYTSKSPASVHLGRRHEIFCDSPQREAAAWIESRKQRWNLPKCTCAICSKSLRSTENRHSKPAIGRAIIPMSSSHNLTEKIIYSSGKQVPGSHHVNYHSKPLIGKIIQISTSSQSFTENVKPQFRRQMQDPRSKNYHLKPSYGRTIQTSSSSHSFTEDVKPQFRRQMQDPRSKNYHSKPSFGRTMQTSSSSHSFTENVKPQFGRQMQDPRSKNYNFKPSFGKTIQTSSSSHSFTENVEPQFGRHMQDPRSRNYHLRPSFGKTIQTSSSSHSFAENIEHAFKKPTTGTHCKNYSSKPITGKIMKNKSSSHSFTDCVDSKFGKQMKDTRRAKYPSKPVIGNIMKTTNSLFSLNENFERAGNRLTNSNHINYHYKPITPKTIKITSSSHSFTENIERNFGKQMLDDRRMKSKYLSKSMTGKNNKISGSSHSFIGNIERDFRRPNKSSDLGQIETQVFKEFIKCLICGDMNDISRAKCKTCSKRLHFNNIADWRSNSTDGAQTNISFGRKNRRIETERGRKRCRCRSKSSDDGDRRKLFEGREFNLNINFKACECRMREKKNATKFPESDYIHKTNMIEVNSSFSMIKNPANKKNNFLFDTKEEIVMYENINSPEPKYSTKRIGDENTYKQVMQSMKQIEQVTALNNQQNTCKRDAGTLRLKQNQSYLSMLSQSLMGSVLFDSTTMNPSQNRHGFKFLRAEPLNKKSCTTCNRKEKCSVQRISHSKLKCEKCCHRERSRSRSKHRKSDESISSNKVKSKKSKKDNSSQCVCGVKQKPSTDKKINKGCQWQEQSSKCQLSQQQPACVLASQSQASCQGAPLLLHFQKNAANQTKLGSGCDGKKSCCSNKAQTSCISTDLESSDNIQATCALSKMKNKKCGNELNVDDEEERLLFLTTSTLNNAASQCSKSPGGTYADVKNKTCSRGETCQITKSPPKIDSQGACSSKHNTTSRTKLVDKSQCPAAKKVMEAESCATERFGIDSGVQCNTPKAIQNTFEHFEPLAASSFNSNETCAANGDLSAKETCQAQSSNRGAVQAESTSSDSDSNVHAQVGSCKKTDSADSNRKTKKSCRSSCCQGKQENGGKSSSDVCCQVVCCPKKQKPGTGGTSECSQTRVTCCQSTCCPKSKKSRKHPGPNDKACGTDERSSKVVCCISTCCPKKIKTCKGSAEAVCCKSICCDKIAKSSPKMKPRKNVQNCDTTNTKEKEARNILNSLVDSCDQVACKPIKQKCTVCSDTFLNKQRMETCTRCQTSLKMLDSTCNAVPKELPKCCSKNITKTDSGISDMEKSHSSKIPRPIKYDVYSISTHHQEPLSILDNNTTPSSIKSIEEEEVEVNDEFEIQIASQVVMGAVNETLVKKMQEQSRQLLKDLHEKDKKLMDLNDLVTTCVHRIMIVFDCLQKLELKIEAMLEEETADDNDREELSKLRNDVSSTIKSIRQQTMGDLLSKMSTTNSICEINMTLRFP